MNKVNLIGNIVSDLKLQDYNVGNKKGKYCRFTLAATEYIVRNNERSVSFIEIVAYDKKAILLARALEKEDKISVTGKIKGNNYVEKNGEKYYKVDIVLDEFTFIDRKNKKENKIS